MLSILESAELGGMIGRTAATVAVPIPGAGFVLSPVGSRLGETVGRVLPNVNVNGISDRLSDPVQIYASGKRNNFSLNPLDQITVRKKYSNAAKNLGYNKLGQAIAAIDPGALVFTPNAIVKN